jgi:hypothetical protein
MDLRTAGVCVAALLTFIGAGYSMAGQAKRVVVDLVLKDLVKRSTLAEAGGSDGRRSCAGHVDPVGVCS